MVSREGDTLKVTRLDRLSRSVLHLVTLGTDLRERGIGLHVIEQGIDTSTMEGCAMFGMLSVLAELQRELIVANTNDGLASARARGRVGGRRPKLTADQAELAQQLYDAREKTVQQIADCSTCRAPRSTDTSTARRPRPASRRRLPRQSPESYRRVTCSLVSELGLRGRHKVVIAALALDDTPLAVGHYHPANGTTEIGGIGTLPAARRQGLAAAVTTALAIHARDHGVHTIFLAYAEEAVARIYARLGFRPAEITLLIANQPARS